MNDSILKRLEDLTLPRAPVGERVWMASQRILALGLFVASLPLLAVLFVAVRTTSRGPFIYRQTRPGLHGRPFQVFKIRTMRPGSDQVRSRELVVGRNDPAVTPIGRILRDLKLDELPQILNVVKGEMALVGPRPIAYALAETLIAEVPGFETRFTVKPGLTSVSQVALLDNAEGDRIIEDWTERFEGERHYLRHRGPGYDLVVIAMTVVFVLRKILRRGRRSETSHQTTTAIDPGRGDYSPGSAS